MVVTLGERVTPDGAGSFVIQRILPPGGPPGAGAGGWRLAGAASGTRHYRARQRMVLHWHRRPDLCRRTGDARAANGTALPRAYSYGRIAGYAKGKLSGGWTLTGGVDTGETDLDEIFDDFDKKDPYSTLMRMSRESAYPTYGDDSTLVDGTPSDGKFYLRADRDGSHLMRGNVQSTIGGTYYLRNERTLYGAQGVYRSPDQTEHGEARVALEAYAATPDRLPGRVVFLGTGGSVYFLRNADISIGSETVSVQLRDPRTGRVISTTTLAHGRDYTINYTQGSVVLRSPLSGSSHAGVITNDTGDPDAQLVVQYEYTPGAGDIDGTSYGGRAEVWVNDHLRLGVTGMVESTGFADQTGRGGPAAALFR